VALAVGDVDEACPLRLAPTSSTTAMLALGDALALCTSARRSFGVDDFHKFHPGGALGNQLLPVKDKMRFKAGQNLPLIDPAWTIERAYAEAEAWSSKPGNPGGRRAGALVIVDGDKKLAGIFTDGDLRRTFVRLGSDAWRQPIGKFMTAKPRHLLDTALVRDAVHLVREFRIDEVPVVDASGKAVGLIDVQDLVALKVIEG
jgi:arabinose-5-phosphate isomerase